MFIKIQLSSLYVKFLMVRGTDKRRVKDDLLGGGNNNSGNNKNKRSFRMHISFQVSNSEFISNDNAINSELTRAVLHSPTVGEQFDVILAGQRTVVLWAAVM